MRTFKLKLPFCAKDSIEDRKLKLYDLASEMVHDENLNVLEEGHFEKVSYVVVENNYIPSEKEDSLYDIINMSKEDIFQKHGIRL